MGLRQDPAYNRHNSKFITVYISGPMTGIENLNKEAFDAAANFWLGSGFGVINPHNIAANLPADTSIRELLRADITAILDRADMICMLNGWEQSNGARMEYYLAKSIGLKCIIPSENL